MRNEKMSYFFEGKEYDKVLSDLYDYCIENDIPITAHCQIGGIEAYPDAIFHFGALSFWCELLDQDKYKNIRLNLAHFGWNQEFNQGYKGKKSWVKDICKMMIKYDYVFTDVSHHRVTLF